MLLMLSVHVGKTHKRNESMQVKVLVQEMFCIIELQAACTGAAD